MFLLKYPVLLLTILIIIPTIAIAKTGEELYKEKLCQICHGMTGKEKIQGMPRLWGQQKLYLIAQMTDILSGKRNNSYSQLMKMNYSNGKPKARSLEKTLSKQEIKALAEFLSQLK